MLTKERVVGLMKREDEIMAEHLLKGGKMLSASCPACGCPLFEVRGETLCVVCAEEKAGSKEVKRASPSGEETAAHAPPPASSPLRPIASPRLADALEETLVVLCARIRDEKDPRCAAVLMEAVVTGIEGLGALRSR
ncbi:MAG: hypothetical protein A4E40_01369 [Methanoregulaceae archaeon PtaU1.Bin059]|nr:MAG: hypothetical protein A4E39_01019 [Methanoregulaceae archaeon PtaB.Bin152]OPY37663.1 MAG: hypothetical protein A4E40_01369 [Methanoregulaceae archaeon PtaU1.Bin059]